jgi:hypothetical protein
LLICNLSEQYCRQATDGRSGTIALGGQPQCFGREIGRNGRPEVLEFECCIQAQRQDTFEHMALGARAARNVLRDLGRLAAHPLNVSEQSPRQGASGGGHRVDEQLASARKIVFRNRHACAKLN